MTDHLWGSAGPASLATHHLPTAGHWLGANTGDEEAKANVLARNT